MGSGQDFALLTTIEFEAGMNNTRVVSAVEEECTKRLISELEQQLGILDRRGGALASYRAEIATQLDRLYIAIAPQKRVPPEILGEIFKHTASGGGVVYPFIHSEPPWSLRAVCSHWRKIAITTPCLWGDISINLRSTRVSTFHGLIAFVDSIIPSRGSLSISLTADAHTPSLIALETLVIPNLSRLENLSLCIPLSSFTALCETRPERFAFIRSVELNLNVHPGRRSEDSSRPTPTFSACVSLFRAVRQLKISSKNSYIFESSVFPALSSPTFPYDQLVELDLMLERSLTLSMVHEILQRCVRVEKFSAKVDWTDLRVPRRFDLPSLHSLKLTGSPGHIGLHILDMDIPWSQLRYLFLSHIDLLLLHAVLQQCSALEECHFNRITQNTGSRSPGGFVLLPELSSLILETDRDDLLLEHLVVPKLTMIQLVANWLPTSQALNMFTRSGCSLNTVVLGAFHAFEVKPFCGFLSHIPTVTTFKTLYMSLDAEVLERIGSRVLLPRLTSVELEVSSPIPFVTMVKDRMASENTKDDLAPALRMARGTYRIYLGDELGMPRKWAETLRKLCNGGSRNYELKFVHP